MTLYIFAAVLLIAFAELIAMVVFRIWEIKKGRVPKPEKNTQLLEKDAFLQTILHLEKKAAREGVKGAQQGTQHLKRLYRSASRYPALRHANAIDSLLKRKRIAAQSQNSSSFLKTVNEYKKRLKDGEK